MSDECQVVQKEATTAEGITKRVLSYERNFLKHLLLSRVPQTCNKIFFHSAPFDRKKGERKIFN